MLDIEATTPDHADPEAAYLAEYRERAESGEAGRIDRANALVESALIAHGRLTGDRENAEARLIADAANAYRVVREAASLVARFERAEREGEAEVVLVFAEAEVARLRALDPAKFNDDDDGIVAPFADGRKGAITRWKRD